MAINRDSNRESTSDGMRVSPPIPPSSLSEIDLVSVGNLWVGNKDGHPFVPRRILMERRIRPFAGVVVVVSARRGRRGREGVRECANNL